MKKKLDLRLIAELMKNSRQSDRELARKLGCSQPTITRMRNRLEKEGYIKEYTIIPDFPKLGFEIMAATLVKFSEQPSQKRIQELRSIAQELQGKSGLPSVMMMSGVGMGYDRIIVSVHEDYSSFSRFLALSEGLSTQGIAKVDSFVISLPGKTHFQPLTMASLCGYLQRRIGN